MGSSSRKLSPVGATNTQIGDRSDYDGGGGRVGSRQCLGFVGEEGLGFGGEDIYPNRRSQKKLERREGEAGQGSHQPRNKALEPLPGMPPAGVLPLFDYLHSVGIVLSVLFSLIKCYSMITEYDCQNCCF